MRSRGEGSENSKICKCPSAFIKNLGVFIPVRLFIYYSLYFNLFSNLAPSSSS